VPRDPLPTPLLNSFRRTASAQVEEVAWSVF
jgi:hypothetical protein